MNFCITGLSEEFVRKIEKLAAEIGQMVGELCSPVIEKEVEEFERRHKKAQKAPKQV